jgi:hypothetical protein
LAILMNTRAIVVWILFLVAFISLGMSCFLITYFHFPPVYHPVSLTLPRLLHVANLPNTIPTPRYVMPTPPTATKPAPLPLLRQPIRRPPPPFLLPRQPFPLPAPLPWQLFPLPLSRGTPSPAVAASHAATNSPVSVSSAVPDASTPSPPPVAARVVPIHAPQTIKLCVLMENQVFVFLHNI